MRDFVSTWNNLFKHCISVKCLLIESLAQGALRKELLIAPFVERLKTVILGKSYERFWQYWNNLLKFCISAKCLLIESLPQGALRKELPIAPFVERLKTAILGKSYERFWQYWNNLLKLCISAEFLLIEDLVQGALRKELAIAPFVECLK